MSTATFLCLMVCWASSVTAVEIVSVDHDGTGDNLRRLDPATGTETLVTNIQGGTAPLAVLFDFEDSATIILTESAVTTVDDKGSVQTTVKQQDGLVVSIGYQRNTTELFGIRENSGVISLVRIDRDQSTITRLMVTNVTGTVKAAYYAWKMGHYCVIVGSSDKTAPDTMLFIDTKAHEVHDQHPVQNGLDIRVLAINYATHNVYAMAAVNGSMWLTVVHMSGQLQQKIAPISGDIGAVSPGQAVVDNAANVFYAAVSLSGSPTLFAFNLGENASSYNKKLAHQSSAIALVIAQ